MARALRLAAVLAALWATTSAAGDRYRVELLVFRNLEVPATPVELGNVRRFRNALELDEAHAPETPVRLDQRDGTFANLWTRLERLAEYEPLLRLTFEQSQHDYHPPVRVHDEVVMGQAIRVAGDGEGGWDAQVVDSLYRLDGTVQLRRSRFLHVDLDLEYRLDGPAWARAFPIRLPQRLPEGFEWVGGAPPTPAAAGGAAAAAMPDGMPADPRATGDAVTGSEPFRLYRLQQTRQVRTDTMQYFDSAFLGAIVRVTTITDPP